MPNSVENMNATGNWGLCPSCRTSVDLGSDSCPFCGWNLNPDNQRKGGFKMRPAVRPKIQCEVDLATTVDRTGSSASFEVGIPKTYEIIVSQLAAKARNLKCWIASHGDIEEGQDFVIHTDGGDSEQAIDDIKRITFGGGGDPAEHHLDAIESLLDHIPWTADKSRSRGAILAFMTDDSKPLTSGGNATELGRKIRDKGILLYLVCEPTPSLMELANAAEGLVFPITNSPDPNELTIIAAKLAASIVASVNTHSTVPMS